MADNSSMPVGNPYSQTFTSTQPLGPDGRPLRPDFNSIGDPNTGLLQSPYMQTSQLNTGGLQALRDQAGNLGPSKWRQLAQSQAAGSIDQQQGGLLSQANAQLASAGGLRSGAAERLAQGALQGGLAAKQGAYGQLALQDEANRQSAISQLPGQELNAANYQSGVDSNNINRATNEITQGRLASQGQYAQGMQAWAAQQMANAVQQPSGGGGLLSGLIPGGSSGGFLNTGLGAKDTTATSGGVLGHGYAGDIIGAPVAAPVAAIKGVSSALGGGGK